MAEGKVLLISSDFPPIAGGQSRHLYDLWSCLPSEQVIILVPAVAQAGPVDAQLGCIVVRVRLPLGDGLWAKVIKPILLLYNALKICRKYPVQAVHCGQVFSAGFAGYGCYRRRKIPYFPYVHGADLLEFKRRFLWGHLLDRILKASKKVIVNSRFTAAAVEACGVDPVRIEVIMPALDLARFSQVPDRDQTRRALGWEGRKIILTLARLVERKGHDMVIRALPHIAAAVPDVEYVIGGHGPHRAALEALAATCCVAERVRFVGFVPERELQSLLVGTDVFAMVSRQLSGGDVEGFGIVFLEANAVGTPVVAGRSGGMADAVADGLSGVLVDPQDVDAIGQALIGLLTDETRRRQLGQQGRARVYAEFDRRDRAAQLWEKAR